MYKLTTGDGTSITIEKPNFIRVHKEGCYLLCPREKAEGVAYAGTAYLWAEGAAIQEIDGGQEVDKLQERNATLEKENKLLKEQVSALTNQMDFHEDCIAEMAGVVYA